MLEPWMLLIAIALFIVGFGLYVLFYRKQRLSKKEISAIRKHWEEILELQDEHPEQAILKADKLLDHALKKSGYSGSLGDKLQQARAVFRDNNGLWSAHKLRNRIAHEMNVKISSSQTKIALKAFQKALYDLGISL